jgi:formylmethanofuran dehydrogenase subunit E
MPTELSNSELDELLRQVGSQHKHLCPRQVLGVRLGMYAAQVFPGAFPQTSKRMLAMVEMDGCFADGVAVATGCSLGHRTMRLADEGKIAVTFIDTRNGRAIRIFALPGLRARAVAIVPSAANRWHAYLEAYKQLPAEELFGSREVALNFDLKALIGQSGARTVCASCGEEILNLREIEREGQTLCQSCAGESYWTAKD